jgi:serine/threonine-protein kinase RsbW
MTDSRSSYERCEEKLMSGDDTDSRVYQARLRMLHDALAFVSEFAAANELTERDLLRLQLVVEELFTNTIMHGYGNECDEPIEISLRAAPGEVRVRYEDEAHTYDPARTLAEAHEKVTGPVEQRPIGHLGVHLVAAIVDDMRYARVGRRNRLQIVMRVAG